MITFPEYSKNRRLARIAAVAVAATTALALAGCAPGSGGADGDQQLGSINTDAASLGEVTLTVWDSRTAPGQNEAQDALNEQFHELYPNITIVREAKAFNDYQATLQLALSSATPPDVVQVNQGFGDLVAYAEAGLIRPLDDYAGAYGWTDRFNASLLAQNTATDDGQWGFGQLYGPSNQAELVGLYYNKALLDDLGIPVPTTLDELVDTLPEIKAAGQLPISLGTSDKYAAIHIFGFLQAILAGSETVNDLVFGQGDVKWTDDATLEAATLLQEWSEKGYVSPGANGQTGSDMATQFGSGQSVFMIAGSWNAPTEQELLGDNVGFTVLSDEQGGIPATEGGLSLLWGVPSGSKNSDAAAAYIDFLISPEAADTFAESGDLPSVTPATFEPAEGSVQADVYAALAEVVDAGTLLPYLDYTTPDFYDVLTSNLQELIGGSASPEKVLETLQAEYEAAKADR